MSGVGCINQCVKWVVISFYVIPCCYATLFWMRYAFSGQKSGRGYALLYLEKIFARREAHGYMLGFYAEGMVRMKFERVRNNGLGRGAERQCLGKGW